MYVAAGGVTCRRLNRAVGLSIELPSMRCHRTHGGSWWRQNQSRLHQLMCLHISLSKYIIATRLRNHVSSEVNNDNMERETESESGPSRVPLRPHSCASFLRASLFPPFNGSCVIPLSRFSQEVSSSSGSLLHHAACRCCWFLLGQKKRFSLICRGEAQMGNCLDAPAKVDSRATSGE